jgi:hypothetical protein
VAIGAGAVVYDDAGGDYARGLAPEQSAQGIIATGHQGFQRNSQRKDPTRSVWSPLLQLPGETGRLPALPVGQEAVQGEYLPKERCKVAARGGDRVR